MVVNPSMGPSIGDILHGPQRENGSVTHSGGLWDDREFRERRDNLYSLLRRLRQIEPTQPSLITHPGLSIMREMCCIPIRHAHSMADCQHFDWGTNEPLPAPINRIQALTSNCRNLEDYGSASSSSSEDTANFASSGNSYPNTQSFVERQPRH